MTNSNLLDTVLSTTQEANENKSNIFKAYTHHGLSSAKLIDNSPLVNPSVSDWLNAASMNWTVESAPVEYSHQGNRVVSPNDKVLFRSDTLESLGIFKQGYREIQNKEVLEFFNEYCSSVGAKITQVGMADGGKKVYAYADLETEVKLVGNDVGSKRLLLIDSRDGSLGFTKIPFFDRLICFNQLAAARGTFGKSSHRHTKSFSFSDVAKDLQVYEESFDGMFKTLNALATSSVTSGQALTFLHSLHTAGKDIEEVGTRTLNKILEMHNKFLGAGKGSDTEEAKGTLYGLLNSVTEYYDHNASSNENNLWKSKTLGAGKAKKEEALNCLELILDGREALVDNSSQILTEMHLRRG